MITEKDNVFYCDCGFSFQRGRSGAHDCADGLRNKLAESEARCAALAAENAGLKAAFDKPQAYLSWHAIPPTWEDPLPCGEYLDVHDDADHKNSDGTDCWPVYAKPEIETPATDAFLAEVRAQGLERLAKAWYAIANETASGISISESSRLKYRQRADDVVDFANEIRQEDAQ